MADDTTSMQIRFWGVRGTVPTTSRSTARYGGNTSCVEVRCGERVLVLDAGTGLYPFGEDMKTREFDILLSHTHIDHIMGLPFLSQCYRKKSTIHLWAGHLMPEHGLEEILHRVFSPPLFPLAMEEMGANFVFHDFEAGTELADPHFTESGIRIETLPLNHPDRATAYRVEYQGNSVCYVTDVEHRDETLDYALVDFIRQCDVFIYDSTFDDDNFRKYAGWGHSTWQHAVRLGDAAEVGSVVLFHHDPGADDEVLDQRAARLHRMRAESYVAKEGLVITLPRPAASARQHCR